MHITTEENPFFFKEKPKKNYFLIFLQVIAIFFALAIISYMFFLSPNQVKGPSMFPTFSDGDILLVSKINYWLDLIFSDHSFFEYKRGDIVVFYIPSRQNEEVVKRIIGIPGDKIAIRDGLILINDKVIQENYLPFGTKTDGGDFLSNWGESLIVPQDSYFVLGDNRNNSIDSRSSLLGFVNKKDIKGKVFFRIYPFEKFGIVQSSSIEI